MDLHFNLWTGYLALGIFFWQWLLVPALISLAMIIFGKRRARMVGVVAFVFFAIPLVAALKFFIEDKMERRQQEAKAELDHNLLINQDTLMAGINIPSGSQVRIRPYVNLASRKLFSLEDIESIALSKPTYILGVKFTGTFACIAKNTWVGVLSEPQEIKGWPCIGRVHIYSDSTLCAGILSRPYSTLHEKLPAGTKVMLVSLNWTFEFPNNGKHINTKPELETKI
jgi:hypothetical protein